MTYTILENKVIPCRTPSTSAFTSPPIVDIHRTAENYNAPLLKLP